MTNSLRLLRHAKSSWDDAAMADIDRPLAPRGRRDAKRLGAHLRSQPVAVDLVLCSPARRARQTLELVLPALGPATVVRVERAVYGAGLDELLALIRGLTEEVSSAMVVGHNPGLWELALALGGRGDAGRLARLAAAFPTAALATLAAGGPWRSLAAGDAELVDYLRVKDLE